MSRKLSEKELMSWLERLIDDGALEMIPGGDREILIPLVMNDAAEVYCVLKGAFVPGRLPDDLGNVAEADPVKAEDRDGILLRDASGTMAAIWYDSCEYEEQLYQYHRIMHCWKNDNEHMRMLVYMIGTIRDKYEYLGKESCNETERSLIPLLEYRPFRSFSPIDQSLDGWYPSTKRGFQAMAKVAREAGDTKLLAYMRAGKFAGKMLDHRIAERIASSGRVFDLIYGRICEASRDYPLRCYASDMSEQMCRKREAVTEKLLKRGFAGSYPVFHRDEMRATVFEEHPFTVPGMDDMEFGLHILVHDPDAKTGPYRLLSFRDPEQAPKGRHWREYEYR